MNKLKTIGGGSCSPALLHGRITTCIAGVHRTQWRGKGLGQEGEEVGGRIEQRTDE